MHQEYTTSDITPNVTNINPIPNTTYRVTYYTKHNHASKKMVQPKISAIILSSLSSI